MAVPFATWAFGGMGVLMAFRGLWNPHRAIARSGSVAACPGPSPGGFSRTLDLTVPQGEPIYSVGSGTVVAVGDDFVHVQLSNEPVVVYYIGLAPDVVPGQHVSRGRRIGEATGATIGFGVMQLGNASDPSGATQWALSNPQATFYDVEPRSWLAVRGFSLTVKRTEGTSWCGPGRHISVPSDVHQQLHMPDKASFALLPVSVTEE